MLVILLFTFFSVLISSVATAYFTAEHNETEVTIYAAIIAAGWTIAVFIMCCVVGM